MKSARFALRLCAAGAALSLVAGSAMAQEKNPPRHPGGPVPAARVDAEAPNARLAALVQAGGNLIRQKGIASIARPRTGVYCIRPTVASGVTPRLAIVTVTPEYFFSELNEIKVQWAARGSVCDTDRIAVYTLADVNADGIYSFSNDVAFSIVVP